jgi:hypothetical protein
MQHLIGDAARSAAGYDELAAWNFSDDVLARRPQELLVVRADHLGWSDWGTPEAIVQTVSALGLRPSWLGASLAQAHAPA